MQHTLLAGLAALIKPISPPSGPVTGSTNNLHRECNFPAIAGLVLVCCLGCISGLRADNGLNDRGLKLIPAPQGVEAGKGVFAVSEQTVIVLGKWDDAEDRFAADRLADEIQTDLGLSLKITASREVMPKEFIPSCVIKDWPALRYRAWQDDISRGQIPTMEFLKQQIRTMSEFKMNMFTMYTQTAFKLKKYPDMAPADGITAEEVKELCSYAKKYHVEVAGNFASFAHMEYLNSPKFKNLAVFINRGIRKGGQVGLNPANANVYGFLADVYGEIAAAIGHPRAARAVGSACGANPLPLFIPCHRAVAATGPGGFSCGLPWKKLLLKLEARRTKKNADLPVFGKPALS
jgi:O-6-methylguanine DNA methyltransferase